MMVVKSVDSRMCFMDYFIFVTARKFKIYQVYIGNPFFELTQN